MSPPPCVPILKAKLNFSLKWGMWPVAERCPNLFRKLAHLPPSRVVSEVVGPRKVSSIQLVTGPTWCARRRGTSARTPEGSWLAVQLNTWSSEMGRKSSELQTVNSSLASSSTNHTGFPHGAKAKEEYLTDVCSLHLKEAIFLSPESRRNDLKFTKLTDPSTQERSGVWDWLSFPVTMFGISTPFMPQDSHT